MDMSKTYICSNFQQHILQMNSLLQKNLKICTTGNFKTAKFSSDSLQLTFINLEYRKSSIKSPGGLFNFGLYRGGRLNRAGGLFIKSSDKDIFGSFAVLLSHILRNQRTILRPKYIKSKVPPAVPKTVRLSNCAI